MSLTAVNDKKNCHWVHLIYIGVENMWPRSNTGGGEGGLQCLHQDEAEGSWRDRLVTSSNCIEMLNRKTTNFETTFAFIWFSWFQGYQPPASSWEERPVSLSCWKRSCKTYNVRLPNVDLSKVHVRLPQKCNGSLGTWTKIRACMESSSRCPSIANRR